MKIISLNKSNLPSEHICCALADPKNQPGVALKKQWLEARFDEGLLIRRPAKPLPGLPFWKDQHWAWSLAFAAGVGLLIWIAVQVAMISYWKDIPIQAVYGSLGLVILGLTLLPPVRRFYEIPTQPPAVEKNQPVFQ